MNRIMLSIDRYISSDALQKLRIDCYRMHYQNYHYTHNRAIPNVNNSISTLKKMQSKKTGMKRTQSCIAKKNVFYLNIAVHWRAT